MSLFAVNTGQNGNWKSLQTEGRVLEDQKVPARSSASANRKIIGELNMIGGFMKKLFGGSEGPSKAKSNPPTLYDGFEIVTEPKSENGQWQVAGRIEKEIDGERKVHIFIRADLLPNEEEAASHTLRKAKIMIDQQGDGIFN